MTPNCWTFARRLLAMFLAILTGMALPTCRCEAALSPYGTKISTYASVHSFMLAVPFLTTSNSADVTVSQLNKISIDPPTQETSLKPGKSQNFTCTIVNRGNVADTYSLKTESPQALQVEVFAADGVTPTGDTNGDGEPDTGVLESGAGIEIVVKVTVPPGAAGGIVDRQVVSAVSTNDPQVAMAATITVTIFNPQIWEPLKQTVAPEGQAVHGTALQYSTEFGNSGGAPATNVVISDPLHQDLIYVEGSADLTPTLTGAETSFDPSTRVLSWRVPSIPDGYRGRASFRATVHALAISDNSITNTVSIVSDQNIEPQAPNAVATPIVEQPLRISMAANKTEAETGDLVSYSVTVENVSRSMTANEVSVIDSLPRGFRYIPGSASLDNVPLPSPAAGTTFNLGSLAPGIKRELSFHAIVSIDAPRGDAVNTAVAVGVSPGGFRLASLPAAVTVKPLKGLFSNKATILGRVFRDIDGNLMPDDGEPGLQGVRIYLEDGSWAITDGAGKFSFIEVAAGEHVLKLDRSTLPAGETPVPLDSSFTGDGGSRFVSVPFGGMARGDFALAASQKSEVKMPAGKPEPQKEDRVMFFGVETPSSPPPLEQQISTMPDTPEILQPAAGTFIQESSTDIIIRVPEGSEYTLRVNGVPLLQKQIGTTIVEPKRRIRICQFVAVRLEPGPNTIVLEVTRAGGAPERKEIEVLAAGAPVKLEVTPDKADLPADGRSEIPFSIALLDRWNRPVAGEQTITISTEKGAIVEKDLDPAKPGHQLICKNGRAGFMLRSTLKSGPDKVHVVAGTQLQGASDLFFTAEAREWIVVGLGSLTVGGNSVQGKVEEITAQDNFEEGIYQDGKLAFFAKGKILGKYILTAAYDSDKEERRELFQQVQPDRYYPIYGDASVRGYDAESQEKYYLKLEQGRSSVLVGDFHTDLSRNEFTRYDRSFNGIKADIDTKNATVKAFGTSTNHSINKDEMPGNGTSGYYFLSRKPIVENSDRITIEVRDRYHSERIVSESEKVRYLDYSIDYRTGAILFREPVPSLDSDLNPVRIIAIYESDSPQDENYIFGGRGAFRSGNGNEVGVTAISEDTGGGKNTLYGFDGTLAAFATTRVKVEGAVSDTVEKGNGAAGKVEIESRLGDANLDAYYRKVGVGFRNPSMSGSEVGTEKYGAKLSYPLLRGTTLIADHFVQSEETTDTELSSSTLAASHKYRGFTLDAGVKYLQGPDINGTDTSSPMIFAGGAGTIGQKLDLSLLREQALAGSTLRDYPTKTLMKLNYRLTERTSAFLTQEFQEGDSLHESSTVAGLSTRLSERMVLTTSYRGTSGRQESEQAATELVSKWNVSKGLSFGTRTGYQLENSMSGDRGQALLGVDSSWEVISGLRLGAKAERVHLVTGSYDPAGVNTAFALSAEYLAREELKTTGRFELRNSPSESTNLYALGGAYKFNESFSLLGKGTYWTSKKDQGRDTLFDAEVGGAYRPLGKNSLYLLALLRYKEDMKKSILSPYETRSLIASVEIARRIRPYLTVNGKYAGKLSRETAGGASAQAYTDMAIAGATWDINRQWDAGLHARLMNQYKTGVSSFVIIPSVGYRIAKNIRASLGYNFASLNDRELAGQDYHSQGPFVEMKFKFDELSIEELYRRFLGTPEKVELPPPPPPPPPPLPIPDRKLQVKATLAEEPVQILGSVDALTLLVNGKQVPLPRGDITLQGMAPDDVIELDGGNQEKPLDFGLSLSNPDQLASWKLVVMTLRDEPVKAITGLLLPRPPVSFDGRDEENEPLRTGEIYRYRLEATYKDGTRVTTPYRLFGVKRTTFMPVSLTGGAFQTNSAILSPRARAILAETAALLKRFPNEKLTIEGHTDSVGSEEANLALSRRRSEAAANYLVNEKEIPAERIMILPFGESKPVASNDIPEGRDLNRRVEVKGEFSETKRPVIQEPYRTTPYVRINRTDTAVSPDGRFSGTLLGAERCEVEMSDSFGAEVQTTVPLPEVALVNSAGVVVIRNGGAEEAVSSTAGVPAKAVKPGNDSALFQLTGKTAPGTLLTLDGKAVPVTDDGSFSHTLQLERGTKVHWIEVRNQAGYGKFLKMTVDVSEAH